MRLDSWDIDAFGPLADLSSRGLSDHPLLVIQGHNESGKTSLFEFIVSMMYGFRPSDPGAHPYAPWNGAGIAGGVRFRMADGTPTTVQRKLGDKAEGRMWIGDESGEGADVNNGPLPFTGTLSRDMFRSLHALGLDELGGLDADTWALMEERLLGGNAFRFLRPSRDVLNELSAHAESKGIQRRLGKEMRRLHRERDQAEQRTRRQLELRERIDGQDWVLADTKEKLRERRGQLQRVQVLLPVIRTIEEIDSLRKEADGVLSEDTLPDDPRAKMERYDQMKLEESRNADKLRAEITRHEQRATLGDEHEAILAVEEDVRALVTQSAVHQQDLVHLNDLDRTKDSQEAALHERVGSLLSEPLEPPQRRALADLDMSELMARVKGWTEARRHPEMAKEQLQRAQEFMQVAEKDVSELPSTDEERLLRNKTEEMRALQSRDSILAEMRKEADTPDDKRPLKKGDKDRKRFGYGLIGLAVVLLILMLTGATTDSWLVGTVSVLSFVAGIVVVRKKGEPAARPEEWRIKSLEREVKKIREGLDLHEYETVEQHLKKADELLTLAAARPTLERRLVNARHRVKEAEENDRKAERDMEAARKEVADYLSDVPITPKRLESPGYDLVTDLDNLRGVMRDIQRIHREHDAISRRALEREGKAASLAEELDIVAPPTSPMDAAPLCQDRLHQALTAQRAAREAHKHLPRLQEQLAALGKRVAEANKEHDGLMVELATLDGKNSSPVEGLRILEKVRDQRRAAKELETHMHATWPDWAERGEEARAALADGLELDLTTELRIELEQQIATDEETIERVQAERQQLAGEFDGLSSERTLADIEGERTALEQETRVRQQQQDRRNVLAAVIQRAEEMWEERHQPQVIRRASEHLRLVSGERYTRLFVDDRRLFVEGGDRDEPMAVGTPLSRATCELIFLSLRVAMAEQMDGVEPLPMLLDEVFVHWDDDRLDHGALWLSSLSENRQVVLFTSRPELAEHLASQASAHVMRMPEPGTADTSPATKATTPATA